MTIELGVVSLILFMMFVLFASCVFSVCAIFTGNNGSYNIMVVTPNIVFGIHTSTSFQFLVYSLETTLHV